MSGSFIFKDTRTKRQRLKDKVVSILTVIVVIGVFIGIGIAIGKYVL